MNVPRCHICKQPLDPVFIHNCNINSTAWTSDKFMSQNIPSDKTELKLEDVKLLPCPMCGGKPIDEWAFAQWCIKCEDCELQIYRGGDMKNFHAIVEAWNRRSEPSKPSETTMPT